MWGNERRLDDHFRGRAKAGLDELAALDPDYLLSDVAEVTVKVPDQFDRDEVYVVPASKLVLSFPISGTTDMLNYQASTFSMGAKAGMASGAGVVLEVIERDLTAELILARIDRLRQDFDQRAGWANSDLSNFKGTAEQGLRANYKQRKERILRDRAVEDALGFPVMTSATARQPVPARRKQVTLEQRKAQTSFIPEPVLDEAI